MFLCELRFEFHDWCTFDAKIVPLCAKTKSVRIFEPEKNARRVMWFFSYNSCICRRERSFLMVQSRRQGLKLTVLLPQRRRTTKQLWESVNNFAIFAFNTSTQQDQCYLLNLVGRYISSRCSSILKGSRMVESSTSSNDPSSSNALDSAANNDRILRRGDLARIIGM